MVIHLVEDDLAVADALSMVLGDLGHSVRCYPDGETFFATSQASSLDSVIVDLGLPGVSGAEVVKRLQNSRSMPRVVVISGKPKSMMDRALNNLPPVAVLRKPLSVSALFEHFG